MVKRMPGLVLVVCGVIMLVLAVVGGARSEAVAPEPQLLTGEHWRLISPEARVAYILGIGNLVEYERHQIDAPLVERQGKSFLPYLARGLSGLSVNEVVAHVDSYYVMHPDQLQRPVVDAIFQAVVLPRVQAERADQQRQ